MTKTITAAYGDVIGPEIMDAVILILKAAEADLNIETVEIGEKLYLQKNPTGLSDAAINSIERNKVLLKAPITTPQGGGFKSLNVALRKAFKLYANVRPTIAYHPFVKTRHPKMDLVILRENQEDLYTGVEYRSSRNLYESIKMITEKGSERIIRYAFEYAIANNRKKLTCMSKDNIMKMTDGTFHKAFDRVAKEYPSITPDHYIIDIGAARLADSPERFDCIVTTNLYGDILSDIAAQISGSVGLAGSSNIGLHHAMFEAVHGSAPDLAGKNIANPSGLLNAAVMMLVHLGFGDTASKIENAWKKTLEDGVHTVDIFAEGSKVKVGTKEFASAVIERLGDGPKNLPVAHYASESSGLKSMKPLEINTKITKKTVGFDVYIDSAEHWPDELADIVKKAGLPLELYRISTDGFVVWPLANRPKDKILSDNWCLRFLKVESSKDGLSSDVMSEMLTKIISTKLSVISIRALYEFMDDTQSGTSYKGFSDV
jgi:isocitrate dehydrogenase